ncbi:MAG: replicative DNA helicase [Magnetococcales bacterium]|nr:replicative DNA helicase [Magnetococcales bacterium]
MDDRSLDDDYLSADDSGVDGDVAKLRRPPFSKEAEQSVLGSVLLDNSVLDSVAEVLKADDFYIGAHRVAYDAMLVMSERGEPIDPILLQQYLKKNKELDSVGGPAYLAELATTVPTTANAQAYARLVVEKSILRSLSREATAIVEDVYQSDQRVDDILDMAEQRIFSIAENKDQSRSEYYSLKSVFVPVFERIETLMENSAEVTGVTSGFVDLDKQLTGMQPSDLLILAGRPAMGKTSLAMNIAANAALTDETPVAVFSLEMSKEQLAMRLLSSEARINAQSLRTGDLRGDDYQKLTMAASRLGAAPIFVDDTPALSVMALRAKARRLRREKKIGLVVVDYLQLMQGSGKSDNRTHEIGQISQGLKAIAKELNVPVIALSQLSRSVESRTDKRPILSDLRESGSIEQDADVVMFVFREEYYKPNDPELIGKAELIVAKQRNGPTGAINLSFLHQYTRFENFAQPDYG